MSLMSLMFLFLSRNRLAPTRGECVSKENDYIKITVLLFGDGGLKKNIINNNKKNWMVLNTVRGAQARARIYSITETARANGLNVYYYVKHLLTELLDIRIDGSVDEKGLERLMPWSKDLPAEC